MMRERLKEWSRARRSLPLGLGALSGSGDGRPRSRAEVMRPF